MTINYLHNGVSVVLDKIIYQHGQTSDIVYQRGSSPTPLTFTAQQANSTMSLNRVGSSSSLANAVVQYSTDNGSTWNNYTLGTTLTMSNVGDTIMWKGNNSGLGYDWDTNYHKFIMSGSIEASGDITSLFNETGGDYALPRLACLQLFTGCSALTKAPNLPSTTLNYGCYWDMFYNCSSITVAPTLPATTLAERCYWAMLERTSITSIELIAPTMVAGCYNYMLRSNSHLNYIKCLATSGISTSNTDNWVMSVASSGTFVRPTGVSWSTGNSGIPSGWTIQNISN